MKGLKQQNKKRMSDKSIGKLLQRLQSKVESIAYGAWQLGQLEEEVERARSAELDYKADLDETLRELKELEDQQRVLVQAFRDEFYLEGQYGDDAGWNACESAVNFMRHHKQQTSKLRDWMIKNVVCSSSRPCAFALDIEGENLCARHTEVDEILRSKYLQRPAPHSFPIPMIVIPGAPEIGATMDPYAERARVKCYGACGVITRLGKNWYRVCREKSGHWKIP